MSEKRANNDWQYGKDDKNWVYGLRWGADPVFMPRQWAENVEAFASALSVETWGELKSELTPEAYADMITLLYEDDEEPSPETSIEIDSVYSYDDGELLPWVNQYMPDWMPDEILESFGVQGRSMVSGPGLFSTWTKCLRLSRSSMNLAIPA